MKRSTEVHPGRARGFTLIEVLVVIAIIALLVGLLLPALGKARQNAKGIKCMAHMRQIALGWHIYADGSRGVIVPGQAGRHADEQFNLYDVGNGKHYRPRWYVAMGAVNGIHAYNEPSEDPADEHSYPVDNEVFLCPEAADWVSTRNSPYGFNYQFLGNTRFFGDNEASGPINFPRLISSVDGSRTIMFADSMGTAAGKPTRSRTYNRPDGSRDPGGFALGGHGYAIDPPRLTARSDIADPRLRSPEHRSAPHERHMGKANVAFCDGHIKPMTLPEMGYYIGAGGAVAFTGGDATNELWSGNGTDDDPPPAR